MSPSNEFLTGVEHLNSARVDGVEAMAAFEYRNPLLAVRMPGGRGSRFKRALDRDPDHLLTPFNVHDLLHALVTGAEEVPARRYPIGV